MSTSPNPLGFKRVCSACGNRFYDMNKRPIICGKCGTEFVVSVATAPAEPVPEALKQAPANQDTSAEDNSNDSNLVSLHDLEDDQDHELGNGDAEFETFQDLSDLDDEELDDLDKIEEDDD